MSKRFTVALESFEGFIMKQELAGSYGNGSHKSLMAYANLASHTIFYRVLDHYKEVLLTNTLKEAIDQFNELA